MIISGEVVKTSQLPKKTLALTDSLVALMSSPLETVTVPVSDFVSFVSTQIGGSLIEGVGSLNYLPKFTGTNTLGNSLIYDNGTNVGIGTTSPTDRLHIVDSADANIFARVTANGTNASAAWVAQNDQVDNVVYRVFGSGVTGTQMGISLVRSASLLANLGGTGSFLLGTFSSTDFVLGTANVERARITTSGNFLIGTTVDSGNKLNVSGAISVGTGGGIINNPSGSDFSITAGGSTANLNFYGKGPVPLRIFGNNNSSYAPFNFNSISATSSFLGYFADWTGSNYRSRSTTAGILEFNNGVWNLTSDTGLTNMSTFTPTTRMTVLANGNVGIGTSTPVHNLVVNGNTGISINASGATFPNIHRDSTDGGMLLRSWNGSVFSNSIKITPAGNVGIGTITDAGFRLDVSGTARIQGTTTITPAADTSAIVSTGYSVTGSGSTPLIDLSGTWNTTGTPTLIRANITATATGGLASVRLIDLQLGGSSCFSVNGFGGVIAPLSFSASTTTSFRNITFAGTVSENTFSASSTIQPTAGTRNIYFSSIGFTPTSGTATLTNFIVSGTINQTGGANGITRGLYIQPTLTAAADWRSIEWNNNTGWGLYGAGSAPNHIAGNLLIGSTNNFAKLYIGGNTVSSDNAIVFAQPVITTSFTNLWSFRSQIVPNATNSVTNVYHYDTRQSVMGTSTITNQFGFSATSSIIGATNNYGFYGDLPSGVGRWNLYMNGTADNYINSSLVIGTTTVNASASLQIDSTTKGFLPPRMTTAQILLISSPAEGLQVYNTDLKTICFYNGTAWQKVTSTAM